MSDVTSASSALGWVDDIERATKDNSNFRTVLFTGTHLQLTVMSLAVGENIGWEMHDHLDQFLRIEAGRGTLKLGTSADDVAEEHAVSDDWAMIIPAGTWHDVVNEGDSELKLYSVYAPAGPSGRHRPRHQSRRRGGRGARFRARPPRRRARRLTWPTASRRTAWTRHAPACRGGAGARTSASASGAPSARTTATTATPGATSPTTRPAPAPTSGARTASPGSATTINGCASPSPSGTASTRSSRSGCSG